MTPRSHADQYVEGASDGVHKIVRERFDEERIRLYELATDPDERAPMDDPRWVSRWTERLDELSSGTR